MKIAVFDLDGTLVSSDNAIISAFKQCAKKHHLPAVDPYHIKNHIGLIGKDFFQQLYGQTLIALESYDFDEIYEDFQTIYYELHLKQKGASCFEGIEGQLTKLHKQGWILALCTGKGRKGAEQDLEANGILEYFSVLKTASDGFPSKPYPQILDATITQCGGKYQDAIMIGDTSYDIQMAAALGVKSLGVLWGYHDRQRLEQAGATRLISDVSLLFTEIESIMNG